MKTRIVNIHNEKYDVLIDRSTKWGNPYSHKKDTKAKYVVSSRNEAIQLYRKYLYDSGLINDISELKGKILGCHCKPKSCHGDILVEILENKNLESFLNE